MYCRTSLQCGCGPVPHHRFHFCSTWDDTSNARGHYNIVKEHNYSTKWLFYAVRWLANIAQVLLLFFVFNLVSLSEPWFAPCVSGVTVVFKGLPRNINWYLQQQIMETDPQIYMHANKKVFTVASFKEIENAMWNFIDLRGHPLSSHSTFRAQTQRFRMNIFRAGSFVWNIYPLSILFTQSQKR